VDIYFAIVVVRGAHCDNVSEIGKAECKKFIDEDVPFWFSVFMGMIIF